MSWDDDLPWELDAAAQAFVVAHPDGATFEQISDVIGVTRERVRQIEAKAVARLRFAATEIGLTAADLGAMLSSRRSMATEEVGAPGTAGAGPARQGPPSLAEELYSARGQRALHATACLERCAHRVRALLEQLDDVPTVVPERLPPIVIDDETEPLTHEGQTTMPKPSRYPYRDKEVTVRELFDLPIRHPALVLSTVGDRLRSGWPAEEAITLAPRARLADAERDVRPWRTQPRQAADDDTPAQASDASVAMSPVGILEALGYDVVDVGRTPAGHAFVVRDGGAR